MNTWVNTLFQAATFKTTAFESVARRRDAFYFGFVTIVAIALIVALPSFIGQLVDSVVPTPPDAAQEAMRSVEQVFSQISPFMRDMTPEARQAILDQIDQFIEFGAQVAQQIEAVPRVFPAPIDGIFKSIGSYLSKPFADTRLPLAGVTLGTWLGYGIWVMLFARLLGGRAGLVSFFGTTALYVVPFLLAFFSFVPIVGPLLSLTAFVWGIAIYVKATAVSQEMSYGRSIAAMFLPLLVAAIIGLLIAGSIGALIGLSVTSN